MILSLRVEGGSVSTVGPQRNLEIFLGGSDYLSPYRFGT